MSRADQKLFMFQESTDNDENVNSRSYCLLNPNILRSHFVIPSETGCHVGYEYARFTLEEVLHVHIRMVEPQLHEIAKTVSIHRQILDRLTEALDL